MLARRIDASTEGQGAPEASTPWLKNHTSKVPNDEVRHISGSLGGIGTNLKICSLREMVAL